MTVLDVGVVHDLSAPLQFHADEAIAECLWTNLRPSEAAVLSDLLEGVYEAAVAIEEEVVARIEQLVVAAALEFGRRFPDAPRAGGEALQA